MIVSAVNELEVVDYTYGLTFLSFCDLSSQREETLRGCIAGVFEIYKNNFIRWLASYLYG